MKLEGLVITERVLVQFNRNQKRRAGIEVFGGIIAIAFTWIFFWVAARLAHSPVDRFLPEISYSRWATFLTILVVLAGFARVRRGLGAIDYWDSLASFLPREGSSGAVVINHHASQVTAPAFAISQMMLAGPRLIMRGLRRWRERVSETASHARTMEQARQILDSETKLHPLEKFKDQLTALRDLGWMGIAVLIPGERDLMVRITLEAQSSRSSSERSK